jgi:hypothetical protein
MVVTGSDAIKHCTLNSDTERLAGILFNRQSTENLLPLALDEKYNIVAVC